MEFYTKQIRCRLIDKRYQQAYNGLYTDPKIMRKIGAPLSPEQAEEQFQRVLNFNQTYLRGEPPRFLSWGIFTHHDEFLGAQGLLWEADKPDTVEMGIMLCQQSSGKGLALEGIGSLIDFSIKHLGIKSFDAHFAPSNKAVERFVLKLGFGVDEQLRQHQGELVKYCYINEAMWQRSPHPVLCQVDDTDTQQHQKN